MGMDDTKVKAGMFDEPGMMSGMWLVWAQFIACVVLIWLGWYVALMAFQQINWARLRAERPDNGYAWTAGLTDGELDGPSRGGWFYARWDSYRFVRIAQEGYAQLVEISPIWRDLHAS